MSRKDGAKTIGIVALVVFALVLPVTRGSGEVKPEPRRSANAAAGDCAACHDKTSMLPASHAVTKSLAWAACRECHAKEGKSLRERIPLDHTHLLAGVSCADCHGASPSPGAVRSEQCLACHGSRDDLVKRTAGVKHNLHTSPHYGADLECDVCHHQHQKSENFCAQCHTWTVTVPNQK